MRGPVHLSLGIACHKKFTCKIKILNVRDFWKKKRVLLFLSSFRDHKRILNTSSALLMISLFLPPAIITVLEKNTNNGIKSIQ